MAGFLWLIERAIRSTIPVEKFFKTGSAFGSKDLQRLCQASRTDVGEGELVSRLWGAQFA
jgi:hypothetical protein